MEAKLDQLEKLAAEKQYAPNKDVLLRCLKSEDEDVAKAFDLYERFEYEQKCLADYPQTIANAPAGYPGNVTAEQQVKLDEFRKILEGKSYVLRLDVPSLLRFLRARKFDVEKATTMFEDCEKWRKENNVDTILKDFHFTEKPEVAKLYPQYYYGIDKDGRPVYYEELGNADYQAITKITTQDRMIQNLVWEYESFVKHRLPACSRKAKQLVETSCTVLDLKGISILSAYNVIGYVREASMIGQNYYPERMGKFYLINAPFGFSTAFAMFKPFLDPVTVQKIFILGGSYANELKKQIEIDNIPSKFLTKDRKSAVIENEIGPWTQKEYQGIEGPAPKPGIASA